LLLQNQNGVPGAGKNNRCSQPVRARTDDNGVILASLRQDVAIL